MRKSKYFMITCLAMFDIKSALAGFVPSCPDGQSFVWTTAGSFWCVESELADKYPNTWYDEGYDCPGDTTLIPAGEHFYCATDEEIQSMNNNNDPTEPEGTDVQEEPEATTTKEYNEADGSYTIKDSEGNVIGFEGKRIFTVEEANLVSKPTGNTVKLRYK